MCRIRDAHGSNGNERPSAKALRHRCNRYEIKIGNVAPYSGPASSYGVLGKAAGAYFDKINADDRINGRKIKFISLDDGYNPAKMVEQARKLVEQDEVLLMFAPIGTPQQCGDPQVHERETGAAAFHQNI